MIRKYPNLTIFGDPHSKKSKIGHIQKAFEIANKLGNDVIWLGDMLDTKEVIRGECLNAYYNQFKASKLHHYVLVGNHDWFNLECKDHSLEVFKSLPNVEVIDYPTRIRNILFLPYFHDLNKFRKALMEWDGADILVMHQGVTTFDYGNGIIEQNGIKQEELLQEGKFPFKLIVSGHFHKYQKSGNLVYMGTPFSDSFGEANQDKFIGVLNPNTCDLELIDSPFPKHVSTTIDMAKGCSLDLDTFRDGNYHRIILQGSEFDIKQFPKDTLPTVKFVEQVTSSKLKLETSIKQDDSNEVKFSKWAKENGLKKKTIDMGLTAMEAFSTQKGYKFEVNNLEVTKITGHNLFSFEDVEISFEKGITIINGFNHDDQTPEGAGKSAIFNILSWVLNGEIPKDAKIDDVIRQGEKSGHGAVELSGRYLVYRSRKPNELYIKDLHTQQVIKGKDATETQVYINDLMGMSFETFCQVVYFAQNYQNKFISSSKQPKEEDRRVKILSEIEELDIFDFARTRVSEGAKELESTIAQQQINVDKFALQIDNLEMNEAEFKLLKRTAELEKQKKLEILDAKQAEALVKLATLEEKYLQLNPEDLEKRLVHHDKNAGFINEKLMIVASDKATLKEKLRNRQNSLDMLNTMERKHKKLCDQVLDLSSPKETKCRSCGTVLDKTNPDSFKEHIQEIKTEVAELEVSMSKLASDIPEEVSTEKSDKQEQKFRAELEANKKQTLIVKMELETANEVPNKIAVLKKQAEMIQQSQNELAIQDVTSKYDESLDKITANLKPLRIQRDKLVKAISSNQDTLEHLLLLKTGFKEAKAYIFQNILEDLTIKTNKYLAELFEVPVAISFSNIADSGEVSKITIDVSIDGNSRPIGLYSGGQFRRIQLAVDLALSEIVSNRSNKPFKLKVFDEYFKDLSEASMEKCLKLFEKLGGTILLIEHNSLFQNIVNQTINVELENGISRVA